MAYTASGRRKRDALARLASGEVIGEFFVEEMRKLATTITTRVKDSGSGAVQIGGGLKRFSTPYSKKWGKKRSDRGLPTDRKNFYFNGDMIEDFFLKNYTINGGSMSFTFGNTDSKQSAKEDGHSKREGVESIFFPSKEEIDDVMENVQKRIDEYLSNALR